MTTHFFCSDGAQNTQERQRRPVRALRWRWVERDALMSNDRQFYSWKGSRVPGTTHWKDSLFAYSHGSKWEQLEFEERFADFKKIRWAICVYSLIIFTKAQHILLNILNFIFRHFPKRTKNLCLVSGQRNPLLSTVHRSHDPVPVSVRVFGWSSTAAETHKVLSFFWWTDSRMWKSIHQPE